MSLFAFVQTGCLIAFALLLLLAAWQDWRTMHIADGISLGVAALFVIWTAAGLVSGAFSLLDLALALACAAGMFGVGALAFAAGAIGGGDVKLAAAAALFAGRALILDFITVTAVVGGLLGLAILAGAPIGPAAPAGGGTVRARLRSSLPYGPAIAAGGLWVAAALAVA
ncbi:MAG: prepilin peptidase [Rhodospirillales bacterium]|nr:prepilin peptidase [Rhodospirillales bacterium]